MDNSTMEGAYGKIYNTRTGDELCEVPRDVTALCSVPADLGEQLLDGTD